MAAKCLFMMKQYELCFYYSKSHKIEQIAKECAASLAFKLASKGIAVQSAAILICIGEFHAACHVLYNNQYFVKMKQCAEIALKEKKLISSKLSPEIIGTELVPIDEIMRIVGISVTSDI